MAESREYLAVLSKAMWENRAEDVFNKTSYENLFAIIHSELNAQLKASLYPEAPALTQKLNHMLDDMEPLFLCGEIVGKACLLLSNYRTNELFSILKGAFLNTRFTKLLSGISTQIPFVVVHSETDRIDLLNYANRRVSLSPAEYRLLITGSGKNHIALNKIIQAFIIQTPLKREDACLIFDNIYENAEEIFGRAVCKRVMCFNRTRMERIRKRGLPHTNAVTCDAGLEEELSQIAAGYNCPLIKMDALEDYLNQSVSPMLYGFRDEFQALASQIEHYYLNSVQEAKATAQEIVGDIVRLGSGADMTLSVLRNASQAKAKAFECEWQKIHNILARTKECVIQVETALRDTASAGKVVPHKVYDDVFSALFDSGRNCAEAGREILSRLAALGYGECELVAAYIQSVSGQNPRIPYGPVKKGEWEKAKMLIEIADLEHLPIELLRGYVGAISANRLVTGKEYYAKAMLTDDPYKTPVLKKSFDRGYEPAGKALLAQYNKGDRQVNLQTLSNALVPEACMMMAERQEPKNRGVHQFANLSDIQFTYYKIAAAREYLPAIGKIIDTIYQSRFSQAYQLHGNQFQDPKFKDMVENGYVLCTLCRFLMNKMYQVAHFSEILGVVLFCLNTNLSEALSLLSGINSGVANYCKGNLYEFGGGVAVDLDQAILYYQRALASGFQTNQVEKRLEACKGKLRAVQRKKKSDTVYQEEESYRPVKVEQSRSSSGLCVITTAACQALNAADDCEELMLLRQFRDTHLQNTAEGEAIVREYYRVAPFLTDSISKTRDPTGIYRQLWERYIEPSCAAIQGEQWDRAKSIYIQMVKKLCGEFGVEIRPQICELLRDLQKAD